MTNVDPGVYCMLELIPSFTGGKGGPHAKDLNTFIKISGFLR